MRDAGRRRRRGYTLVEVIVVLALISLVVGIAGLAFASLKAPQESTWVRAIRDARTSAVRTGHSVNLSAAHLDTGLNHSPRTTHLFLPDGRVIGPGVDPLTGSPDAAR